MARLMTSLHLYLWAVFLCVTFCLSQEPILTLNAGAITAKYEGESVELICQVQNLNGRAIAWLKGTNLITSYQERYIHVKTSNETTATYTLTILNLRRKVDTAIHSCAVYTSGTLTDPVKEVSTEVIVYYFPDDTNPVCNPNGQTVITEGTPVTFHCESDPGERPVLLAWSRSDMKSIKENIFITGVRDGTCMTFPQFTFVPTKNDFGINVSCTISSNAIFPGKTSTCTVGPLVVQYSPSDVAITNQTYSVGNTTYDALSCSATAFPPDISYSWSFNTPLDSSQQMVNDNNQTLVILNITECDSPIIATCLATNDIGNRAVKFTLCEPPNPVCNPNGQAVLTEGIPKTFNCVSLPGGSPEWSRDMGMITENNIERGDLANGYKYANYTFVPTKDDTGVNFTCTVMTDPVSPDTCTIGPLLIRHIPSDVALTNQTYSFGNTTYDALSCSASAFPPDILYSWSFNTPLDSSQQMVTDDNQTLVILNITECESRIIATCLATNDIGNRAVNFTLCEPPPPPPPTSKLTTPKVITPKVITLKSTKPPPTTTANKSSNKPQAGALTPAILSVIIGGGIIIFALIIGVVCIILRRHGDSGEMDKMEKDEEIPQYFNDKVQLKRDSRVMDNLYINDARLASICYTEEDILEEDMSNEAMETAMDNPAFEDATKNQQEGPKEVSSGDLDDNEDMIDHLEGPPEDIEGGDENKTEVLSETPDDSGNEADKVDDENKDDGNQGNDQGDSNQEENSSQHDNYEGDDEEMVDAADIEVEAELYPSDPRKSMVHQALLAVQVSNTDSTARGGLKVTSEMEI